MAISAPERSLLAQMPLHAITTVHGETACASDSPSKPKCGPPPTKPAFRRRWS